MKSNHETDPPLFVWRESASGLLGELNEWEPAIPSYYGKFTQDPSCLFCGTPYVIKRQVKSPDFDFPTHYITESNCEMCGFYYHNLSVARLEGGHAYSTLRYSQLRKFTINSEAVLLKELASHLKRKFSDVYALDPRRFEQLTGQIYADMGYRVRITKTSRDGGVDIILLEENSNKQILVQCKRYAESRKISVSIIREMLGVELIWGIPRAAIVTTSTFTSEARKEAETAKQVSKVTLDLIDSGELLKHLQVYNETLPPFNVEIRIRKEARRLQNK